MSKVRFVALALLHAACGLARLSSLAVLFSLGWGGEHDDLELIAQAWALLALQLLTCLLCTCAAWTELRAHGLRGPALFLLPVALPILSLAQMLHPWLAWKERRALKSNGSSKKLPRFHFSGADAVAEGTAFAGTSLYILAADARLPDAELDMRCQAVLWCCAGLSLLSASLALIEIDCNLSETADACLSRRGFHAFLSHLMLRATEICSRIWIFCVLAFLIRSAGTRHLLGGFPVVPVVLLVDYVLTAMVLFGTGCCSCLSLLLASLLLALPAMSANLVKFIDTAAWGIRARRVTRRLAWIRHIELLAAVASVIGCLASETFMTGSGGTLVTKWIYLRDVLTARNALPLAGGLAVLLHHLFAFAVRHLGDAQIKSDGLHRAAARGDAEALGRILRDASSAQAQRGPASTSLLSCRVNSLSPDGLAPLHLAAQAGADRAARVLLHARADVSILASSGGETPLMFAAAAGHDRVVRLLIGSGSMQDLRRVGGPDGNTPLHFAAHGGHAACVHRLLRSRADPMMENSFGFSAFDLTSSRQQGNDFGTGALNDTAETPSERTGGVAAPGSTPLSLQSGLQTHAIPTLPAVPPLPRLSIDRTVPALLPLQLPPRPGQVSSPPAQLSKNSATGAPPALDANSSLANRTTNMTTAPGYDFSSDSGCTESPSLSPALDAQARPSDMLDVPVMVAQDSALDELLADASNVSMRRSVTPGATTTCTESTFRAGPSNSTSSHSNSGGLRRSVGVPGPKVTGLSTLVALSSPGAVRCLARNLLTGPQGKVRRRHSSQALPYSDSESDGCRQRGRGRASEDYHLSNFPIVGLIGEGNFGTVYEVCDRRPVAFQRSAARGGHADAPNSEPRCALKILHRRQYRAQDMFVRAKQERQVLKAAKHPFIVRLLCAFRTPAQELALVMEYCPGGNLNDLIVRNGRPGLSEKVVRQLLAEVLLALAYLHDELDVVFRDMKPENIVLDAQMHAKLTDFGLSKVDASLGDGARSFVGSTYFVAPEVTPAGLHYGTAVDIYGLGLVAWVSLTGGASVTSNSSYGGMTPIMRVDQRLPPDNHEALRAWLDIRRSAANVQTSSCASEGIASLEEGIALPGGMSALAFHFIDKVTSSDPSGRGTAKELRESPFFVASPFTPVLSSPADWAALLPNDIEEPASPLSAATEDSWAWVPSRRS